MGSYSTEAGASWEEVLENKLDALSQLGIVAWWEHQQPQLYRLGVMRVKGRPVTAYGKGQPSGADISGVLTGGRAFALEAKSFGPKDGKPPILIYEEISDTQVEHLNAVARAGGLALLAAQFRHEDRPWLRACIPWNLVPWERAVTRHRLLSEDAQEWRIPTGGVLFEHLIATPATTLT